MKEFIFLLNFFILINNNMINTSYFQISYFTEKSRLSYVNAMKDDTEIIYFEFGADNSNTRYYIGINPETEEYIKFNDKTFTSIDLISSVSSVYHESIIKNINNNRNIFSFDYNNFFLINIDNISYSSEETKNIIQDYNSENGYSKSNCIIKLKNNNYLLSITMKTSNAFFMGKAHLIYFNISSDSFTFFQKIENYQQDIYFTYLTDCFQTDNSIIECFYGGEYSPFHDNEFAIYIFDDDYTNYKSKNFFGYFEDSTYLKIFHLKGEIGVYLFFDKKDNNLLKIFLAELNNHDYILYDLIEFNSDTSKNGNHHSITINPGNKQFKPYLYYSDAIKINNSKFVVISTVNMEFNIIICLFDLYNNDTSLRIRYYYLNFLARHTEARNMKAFEFKNTFGLVFYDAYKAYPGYLFFNYPLITRSDRINSTAIEIKLFRNSSEPFYFHFKDNIKIINNIYGGVEKIKIINYSNIDKTGVNIKSLQLDLDININQILDINDSLIFEQSSDGVFPGKFILEYVPLIKIDNDSNALDINYYGNAQESDFDKIEYFSNEIYKLIYNIECYDKCKTCSQLGNESFYYCVNCLEENFINFNNGEKCICNEFIFINNNSENSCIMDCDGKHYKYIISEDEKYCLNSCEFAGKELYKDEYYNLCYENCSQIKVKNYYTFEKTCVTDCPENFIPDENNICILENNNSYYLYNFEKSETNVFSQNDNLDKYSHLTTFIEEDKSDRNKSLYDSVKSLIINEESELPYFSSFFNSVDSSYQINQTNIITKNDESKENTQIAIFSQISKSIKINDKTYFTQNIAYDFSKIGNKFNSLCFYNNSFIEKNTSKQEEILKCLRYELTNNFNITYLDIADDIIRKEGDITFIITTSYNQEKIKNMNISRTSIDLSECFNLLINKNKIKKIENLYILKLDIQKKGMIPPQVEYEVYYYPENQLNLFLLNLSICKNTKIEVLIPINITLNDIDKYNTSSSYYNDVCNSFTTDSGTDITLKDRRIEYIKNSMSLCEEGCEFLKYDFKLSKAICSCFTKSEIEKLSEIKLNKTRLITNFKKIKNIVNLELLKCAYLLFNKNEFIYNSANYIMLIIFIISLITLFLFIYSDYKKLKVLIKNIINAKKSYENNISQFKNKGSNKNKKRTKRKNLSNTTCKTMNISKDNNKDQLINQNIIPNKEKKDHQSSKKNNNENLIAGKILDEKKNTNKTNEELMKLKIKYDGILSFHDLELNNLDYEDAIKYDERTYCQFYISLLKTKHIFLTIFNKGYEFNIRMIKIYLFFFTFAINYSISILFYNYDTMHEIYIEEGAFNFIYQIPQIIYSTIITGILGYLISKLGLCQNNIIIIKTTKIENLEKVAKNEKKNILIKFIIFFIITYILLFGFWIYSISFCIVYKNTQFHLLKDVIISFTFSLIKPLFISLIPSAFRIRSLKKTKEKKKLMYNFSKILQIL